MVIDVADVPVSAPDRHTPRQALLMVPSGRIAHRLPLGDEPWTIDYAGYLWRWSHTCASGVTYARGRQLADGNEERA